MGFISRNLFYFARVILSISKETVPSKLVCHTRSTTELLDVFSTLPNVPSVLLSTRSTMVESSLKESTSVSSISSTHDHDKDSSTVSRSTMKPSKKQKRLVA